MKQATKRICLLIFLILCTVTILFLQKFTESKESVQYIEWQSAVKVEDDGTEIPLTPESYVTPPQKGDTFRFTTELPPNNHNGNLLFETSGLELTLEINGNKIWSSFSEIPEGALNQAQAVIPLPENSSGKLVMSCTVHNETISLFPPMLRFESLTVGEVSAYAYANLYGIPAGASSIIMLIVAGLFMLSIVRRQIDWSLIPLFLAALGITLHWITQGLGYHFLPEKIVSVLTQNSVGIITFGFLVVFLLMNRHRDFYRYFGLSAAGSAVVFTASYLVSLANDGYFYRYIRIQLDSLMQSGYYNGLLYWATVWLTIICAVISAYVIMQSFANQQAEAQALNLKNRLITDSYQVIKNKMRAGAELRHEMNHKIMAMDALYQKGDLKALGDMIAKMKEQSTHLSQTYFTENFTVNAILQDAAYRASKAGISFQAIAHVPAELTIPESDLCELLMNMLDNAVEAAEKTEKEDNRFIRFYIESKNGFLAVKCENSFAGIPMQNEKKEFLTVKGKKEVHGFGVKLMSSVAERYNSILDVSYSDDNVFTVQTALKLPNKKRNNNEPT